MRKFPIYSLLQELTMQGMMVLLILGYIGYSFMDEWGLVSYILMGITGVGIILLFRNQIASMRMAKVIHVITNQQDFSTHRNLSFTLLMNLLVVGLSILHFYLFSANGKDIQPLYTEYGVGAVLGAGLWVFEFKRGQLMITEQGVVVGSKLRPSLVCWSAIQSAKNEKGTVTIAPKQTFGVKTIEIRGIRATQQLVTLLRIHNKLK